jgi:hypothetical protein
MQSGLGWAGEVFGARATGAGDQDPQRGDPDHRGLLLVGITR